MFGGAETVETTWEGNSVGERPPGITRRHVLGVGAAGVAALVAGCTSSQPTAAPPPPTTKPRPPAPTTTAQPTTTTVVPGGPATQIARATSGRPEVALTFHGAGELSI